MYTKHTGKPTNTHTHARALVHEYALSSAFDIDKPELLYTHINKTLFTLFQLGMEAGNFF